MPDVDLDELIDALQGVKKRKNDEAVAAALNRKFSLAELKEAWASASPEEREEFRQLFGGTPVQVASEDTTAEPEKEKPKKKPPLRAVKEAPPKRTRPGRKAGQVYAYDIDDDGQRVELDVARVYNGPDEDDEVEVPDAPEPADDDAADDAAADDAAA